MKRPEFMAVLLAAMVLAGALLHPALQDLDTSIPGAFDSELPSTAGLFYRAQRVMLEGGEFPPSVFPNLSHRDGGRLYPLCMVSILLTLPLHPLLSPQGMHTVFLALQVVLSFIFAYMLMRRLSGSGWSALPGALIYAASPYMVSHLCHGPPEDITIAWLPLAMLAADHLAASNRFNPVFALLTGGAIFLAFFDGPYNGVFTAMAVTFVVLCRRGLMFQLRRRVVHLGLVMATATVFIAPLAVAIKRILNHELTMAPGRFERITSGLHERMVDFSTVQDLGAFLLPTRQYHHELYRHVVYIGLPALAVALLAMIWVARARRWGILLVGGLIFCLGGTLRVGGETIQFLDGPLRLPASYICRLPLMTAISHPYRFFPVVLLAMGVMIAMFLARAKPGWHQRVWSLILSAVFLVDLALMYPAGPGPVPALKVPTPRYYESLGREPGDYGILDVPTAEFIHTMGIYQMHQLTHRKFIPYNMRDVNLQGEALAFANGLRMPSEREPRAPRFVRPFECQVANCKGARELAAGDFRYLVLHRQGVEPYDTALKSCVERCLKRVVHADDQVRVYDLTAPLPRKDKK